MSKMYPWGHSRRFNSYSDYFKKQFGSRVQKVTIDAGFTCPNRDGSVGKGGCTYCNNEAFNPSYCVPDKPVSQQISEGLEFHKKRYKSARKFIAYFQAYTNTYDSLDNLKQRYNEALAIPGIIGLVIGTRPDAVNDEQLKYFRELSEKVYLILEFGIESCYDVTLERINRGHSFAQTREAIEKTAGYGIRTGGHLIFGLPGESRNEMLDEAKIISGLPLNNVKFHQLQIIKGTKMAREYIDDPSDFNLFNPDGYVAFCADFVEQLRPDIVIERIAGESPPRFILDNFWGLRYDQVLNKFEGLLEEKNTWQGKYYRPALNV